MKYIIVLLLVFLPFITIFSIQNPNDEKIKLTIDCTKVDNDSIKITLSFTNNYSDSLCLYRLDRSLDFSFCASLLIIRALSNKNVYRHVCPSGMIYDVDSIFLGKGNTIYIGKDETYSFSFNTPIFDILPYSAKNQSYKLYCIVSLEKSIFQDAPESFLYGEVISDTVKFTY